MDKPKDKNIIIRDFNQVKDKGVTISEIRSTKEETTRTPLTQVQMELARFTMIMLMIFFGIPFILFSWKALNYEQLIDLLTKIMALLGPLIGAVFGYYFRSMQKR